MSLPTTILSSRKPLSRCAGLVAALAAAAVLAGCATTRRIESDVSSYGSWPAERKAGAFAFERLPSQQAQPDRQAELEAAALPALETAGFRPVADGGSADVRVQVASRTLRYQRSGYPGTYYGDPFWRGGAFYGSRWRGGGFGSAYGGYGGYGWGTTYYLNEVSLLILDNRTQQVLYETRALNDGLWADAAARTAMFEAALHDFPRPAVNPRRVVVELPPR